MEKAAVLDQDYLMVNFHQAGFSYLLPEILTLFRGQATNSLHSIEEQLKKMDTKAIAMEAHTLKGAAGSVGAAALAQMALQLEESAPGSDIDSVTLQVGSLRKIIEQTETAIDEELARLAVKTDDDLDIF